MKRKPQRKKLKIPKIRRKWHRKPETQVKQSDKLYNRARIKKTVKKELENGD